MRFRPVAGKTLGIEPIMKQFAEGFRLLPDSAPGIVVYVVYPHVSSWLSRREGRLYGPSTEPNHLGSKMTGDLVAEAWDESLCRPPIAIQRDLRQAWKHAHQHS